MLQGNGHGKVVKVGKHADKLRTLLPDQVEEELLRRHEGLLDGERGARGRWQGLKRGRKFTYTQYAL